MPTRTSPQSKITRVLAEAYRSGEKRMGIPGVNQTEIQRRAHLTENVASQALWQMDRDGDVTDVHPSHGSHSMVYRLTKRKAEELGLTGGSGN